MFIHGLTQINADLGKEKIMGKTNVIRLKEIVEQAIVSRMDGKRLQSSTVLERRLDNAPLSALCKLIDALKEGKNMKEVKRYLQQEQKREKKDLEEVNKILKNI
jgi:hypothetical protein